jgi:hypothetical protein
MSESSGLSPAIVSDGWGLLRVGGATYKDAKLWPGGAREWNWTETGTSHLPGIAPADVDEVVDAGAAVVLLSTGRGGRLGVPDSTVDHLRRQGVDVEVLRTEEAISRYNDLAGRGVAVGALIHSTC